MMREPPLEEPLRLRHLPLGGAVPKVSEASRKSRLCGRNCNSALPPPLSLLTFSGRQAKKKKKKKLESFCNQGDRRQLLVFFPSLPLFFFPAFQFGMSPAVGVAEVAAQSYYVSSLRGSANDSGQRGGVALNLFQAQASVDHEPVAIARCETKYSSGHHCIWPHADLCFEEA